MLISTSVMLSTCASSIPSAVPFLSKDKVFMPFRNNVLFRNLYMEDLVLFSYQKETKQNVNFSVD